MDNEKVNVPVALLEKMFGFIQQPFLNAKDKETDVKVNGEKDKDDDSFEYEGKMYSKKELVNCYTTKKNEMSKEKDDKKAEEEKEKQNALEAEEAAAKLAEEEKLNAKDSNDDMEFFNSMQKLMAEANTDTDDKVEVHSQNKGLELGSKAFG